MNDPIKAFRQFGFVEEKPALDGKHVIGTCPFCLKPGHFYINMQSENKTWDCKKCGLGGGFQKFLQAVVKEGSEAEDKIKELARHRGLSQDLLKSASIGFINNKWIVPVFAHDGKTVLNIKMYDMDSFINTSGCSSAIYGLWAIPEDYDKVYVCEGEWDTLAMMETVDEDRTIVIGVPGAGHVFKSDTLNMFIGKSVWLLYDNDQAGNTGCKKAVSAIAPVASELKVLSWPEGTEDGWDVRDVLVKQFRKDPVAAKDWIDSHCELVTIESQQKNVSTPDIYGDHVPVNEVYKTYQKWLYLKDNKQNGQRSTDIYDIIFGTVFANRIPGCPVWMYIIAPPGGLKTEPLLSLMGGKLIEFAESLTPASLISGIEPRNGIDPSLIPKFNGKVIADKEWTVMLGLPEYELKQIMSILRGAFDGHCCRDFGTGLRKSFKSRFGIIAAVTPIIEQYSEQLGAVGERFLSWVNHMPEEYGEQFKYMKKAMDNTTLEQKMRAELNTMAKRVLLCGIKKVPDCSDEYKSDIIKLAQWISIMRGTVTRDRSRKIVTHVPFAEMGTRLTQQLYKLALGISIFKGHPSVRPDTMRVLRSVARSSSPARYYNMLRLVYNTKGGDGVSVADINKRIGLPSETIDVILENMKMLKVLTRDLKDNKVLWRVKDNFYKLSKETSVICN